MKIRTFKNTGFILEEISSKELAETDGMWATLVPVDIDNDGDLDYVVGNCGLNNQYKASVEKPYDFIL